MHVNCAAGVGMNPAQLGNCEVTAPRLHNRCTKPTRTHKPLCPIRPFSTRTKLSAAMN